jgi:hypothetical protein
VRDAILLGGQAYALHAPPTPAEKQTLCAAGVLRTEALEHGAYYAGQLRSSSATARWHQKKRRFVYAQYAMGSPQVKTIPHLDDAGTGDLFLPLSKTQPKGAERVTEYAFETAD